MTADHTSGNLTKVNRVASRLRACNNNTEVQHRQLSWMKKKVLEYITNKYGKGSCRRGEKIKERNAFKKDGNLLMEAVFNGQPLQAVTLEAYQKSLEFFIKRED